jgi:hypothetical protein
MRRLSKMTRRQFIVQLQAIMEPLLGEMADAFNNAEEDILSESEQKVRDLFALARREAYKLAVQLRAEQTTNGALDEGICRDI